MTFASLSYAKPHTYTHISKFEKNTFEYICKLTDTVIFTLDIKDNLLFFRFVCLMAYKTS